MAIIQLISDFQTGSYKIGLLHTQLLQRLKSVDIVDISHDIKLNNIIEASFVLNHIQLLENQTSIVVVCVGLASRVIIYQHHQNWYILPDNGLVTLVFDVKKSDHIYSFNSNEIIGIIEIISENRINELIRIHDYQIKIQKKPQIQDNMLISERIFTDKLGNCYFNLTKEMFDNFFESSKFSAKIQYVRDTFFYEIYNQYDDVNPGDSLLKFSRSGFLKLAINQGNAAQLFRIKENSQIIFHKL